jgi:hypothetical protein
VKHNATRESQPQTNNGNRAVETFTIVTANMSSFLQSGPWVLVLLLGSTTPGGPNAISLDDDNVPRKFAITIFEGAPSTLFCISLINEEPEFRACCAPTAPKLTTHRNRSP